MITHSTRLLVVCLVALFSLFSAVPVSAAKPFIEPFGSIHTESIPCGDFDAIATFGVTGKFVLFSDNSGTLVRVDIQFELAVSAQNLASGKIFEARTGKLIMRDNLLAQTSRQVGLMSHLVIPGQGPVSLRAGRIVFDANRNILFESGRILEGDITQALCSVLAEP